jgi:hypothetical protein
MLLVFVWQCYAAAATWQSHTLLRLALVSTAIAVLKRIV